MAKRKTKSTAPRAVSAEGVSSGEIVVWTSGAILIVGALFAAVSMVSLFVSPSSVGENNWLGELGAWTADRLAEDGFGVASLLLPVFSVAVAMRVLSIGRVRLWKWFANCVFLLLWISTAGAYLQRFEAFTTHFLLGGMHGREVVAQLVGYVGMPGVFFVLVVTAAFYVLYLSGETVRTIRRALTAARLRASRQEDTIEDTIEDITPPEELFAPTDTPDPIEGESATTIEFLPEASANNDVPEASANNDVPEASEPEFTVETRQEEEVVPLDIVKLGTDGPKATLDETGALEPYDPKLDLENYRYPTLDLLDKHEGNASAAVDMDEQRKNRDQIVTVLKTYGVDVTSIKATVGPTVTLYELTPAPGVRISKIRNLEDEIALSLCALGIRIIAPMPGKNTVGIEVPNRKAQVVSMESLLNSRKFQESDYDLPIAIGKTITNEIFMVDLCKMPHLLVAGATGQGKSVGLNAIITSLLYRKHPAELKLVMVDPKKVEFSVYAPIVNHFLAQVEGTEDEEEPIITDVTKVVQTLKSLCQEMDTRYDLLKRARVRNMKEYNRKFKDRQLNPENGHRFMPYVVVIIDEFGDLIMTAGKEIEMPIARIAQLARAVGIHMIIATQRPTVNIITGSIKANFPARIAFKVASGTDSKTVLDRPGAQSLVGKGDMLFLAGMEPVRVQCAFVDTPEVERVANFIACQQSYNRPHLLPPVESEESESGAADVDMTRLDPMFKEIAEFVVANQTGSTSTIQRKYAIGYNRAGRLMDQLEKAGIVGPVRGSKPREVCCVSMEQLDMILNNLG